MPSLRSVLPLIGAESAMLRDARIAMGSAAGMNEMARVAASASRRVKAEMFVVTDPHLTETLMTQGTQGRFVSLVQDGAMAADPRHPNTLRNVGNGYVGVFDYPNSPFKMHSKAIAADDGILGAVSTATPSRKLRNERPFSFDVTAVVDGEAASALSRGIAGPMTGSAGGKRRSLAATFGMARQGVFVNDRLLGVRLLGERIDNLLETAGNDRLWIASKMIQDKRSVRHIARAMSAGADVHVWTLGVHDNRRGVAMLREAGIPFTPVFDKALHGNAIIAGDTMYSGTAALTRRGLARESANRYSREMGFFTDDPSMIEPVARAMWKIN